MAQRRRRWRVRLSEPAEHDYVAILQWTAEQFGRRQASVYRGTLIGALIALADDPFAPDSRPRDDGSPACARPMLHGKADEDDISSSIARRASARSTSCGFCTIQWTSAGMFRMIRRLADCSGGVERLIN